MIIPDNTRSTVVVAVRLIKGESGSASRDRRRVAADKLAKVVRWGLHPNGTLAAVGRRDTRPMAPYGWSALYTDHR